MYLYHIKRSGMSTEEGYIGITTNTTRRFEQHLREKRVGRNLHIYNALRKYDDIEMVILEEGEDEYIRQREYALRPLPDMGWNHAVGGSHNGGCTWKGKKRPEHAEAMKVKGFQPGNVQGTYHPVMAEGVVFNNKKEASVALGINPKTIYNRCKRGVDGYKFIRSEAVASSLE